MGILVRTASQSMFLSRNKKNNVYPSKPQFYYIKVGFKGSKLYRHVFIMSSQLMQKNFKYVILESGKHTTLQYNFFFFFSGK